MGSTQFGNFHNFCRDSTFTSLQSVQSSYQYIWGNLGSILIAGIAIVITAFLIWRSDRKQAAVGRREMQLFLLGYLIIEICEIFTVGEFPLSSTVRIAFTGIHIGMISATLWILMLNAVVGYQIIDDGTSHVTSWTEHFDSSLTGHGNGQNRNIALYVLYQLAPLVFLFVFFVLETVLVIKVLGERKPMIFLAGAAVLFAVGQNLQLCYQSPYLQRH
ncbi:hypothetical protein DID88_006271 [Monilinia fructigena]|uniref:Uncharacterized protein n=1 Tax=Monilinia fructigena TaxID=38457 RepID=A0A395J2K6_9HELO|nr:hypothetical protein DID88_006271 [Monilinia fructigena]